MLKLLVTIYVCYCIPAQLNIHLERVLFGGKHKNSKVNFKFQDNFLFPGVEGNSLW